MNPLLLGVLAYVLLQLLVGVAVSRRIRTEDDYLLAGRRLGPGLATFTIFATWFGAETCMGAAGAVYEDGLAGASTDPVAYSLCLLVMGLVFAVPLWRRQLTTLADLFRVRYSPGVERLAAVLMVPSSVLWAAAQLRAFGQVLGSVSDLQLDAAIAIATGIVLLYTTSGGMMADVVTDFVQGLFLALGLGALLYVVVDAFGGVSGAIGAIPPERLNLVAQGSSWLEVANDWAIPIFGSVVAQELVSRVLAARSPGVARRSSLYATALYLGLGSIPVFVGLLGPQLVPDLTEPEQLLPHLAGARMGTLVHVLFAGALVSAILSTVDTALLVAGSLTSHNLLRPYLPSLTEAGKVRAARLCVAGYGIVAFSLALSAEGIFELVHEASAFGTAGIFVVVALGLFSRRGGARAAYAALVLGTGVWLVLTFVTETPGAYLASLGAALVGYVALAATEKRSDTAPA